MTQTGGRISLELEATGGGDDIDERKRLEGPSFWRISFGRKQVNCYLSTK